MLPALLSKDKKVNVQNQAIYEEEMEDTLKKMENDESRGLSTSKAGSGPSQAKVEEGRDKIIRMIEHNFRGNDEIYMDGSSIGSSINTKFAFRDSLKKIRMSINSKSAPLNLKISLVLVSCCILFCILVNIICTSLSDSSELQIVNFIFDSKNLTDLLIDYNKLGTYIEFTRLQNKFSPSGSYQQIYSDDITAKINAEANRTLDDFSAINDFMVAQSFSGKDLTAIQQFFYFESRNYLINGVVKNMPTMSFLLNSLNILYAFIKKGYGTISSESELKFNELGGPSITSNQNKMLSFNLDYFSHLTEISSSLLSTHLGINLADIIVRSVLILLSLAIAMPMLFVSMEKSNEILQMISKISMYNIQFYNNHYNKLISFLNADGSQMDTTLEKVADAYRVGLREKERKERQNLVKLRMKGSKDYKKKKTLWVAASLLIFVGLMAIQSPKSIVTLVAGNDFATSVKTIIKIPISVNAYSAINLLGFKMLAYPMNGVDKDSRYQESKTLINKFFDQTIQNKETIGETRLQIKDAQFEDIFNRLFSQNMCDSIFSIF